MGRYQTEAAYVKSVLLWLQGNWTEPDPPRFYPLREVRASVEVPFCSEDSSALSRRDVTIDHPRSCRHEVSQDVEGADESQSFGIARANQILS
jgi:hypothetical protein